MLPSSPPLLLLDDLIPSSPPPLPTLPSLNSKKRRLSDYASNSSDPIFSEDPSEAELYSADSEPRKKHIRAPWWALNKDKRVAVRDRTRRRHRNNDSGIWMQSDDSVASQSSQQSAESSQLPVARENSAVEDSEKDDVTGLVHERIHAALESGCEVVDLSYCNLEQIANEMLRPLHQMIKHPHDHDNYRPLTPELQLYLAGNSLRALPTEIFRLESITVLSLRNNNLESLPPQIGQLRNLQELNVAGNQLRYMPWEIFGLMSQQGKLRRLTFYPNPAYTTSDSIKYADWDACQEHHNTFDLSHKSPYWLKVSDSPIAYHDNAGRRIGKEEESCMARQAPNLPPPSRDSMPSLFDLVLQRISKANAAGEAAACLPNNAPTSLITGVHKAAYMAAAGMSKCSTCERPVILPRATWIEWWMHCKLRPIFDDMTAVYPFMRQACSYACAKPSSARYLT